MNGSRQWRWKRKRGRSHQQRAATRSHLDGVQRRINGCHSEDVEIAPLRQPSHKTWGTLSLREHLAARDQGSRHSLASLARSMRAGPYSRAMHSRRVTGVLLSVLAESLPDRETVIGVALLMGLEVRHPGRRELFYTRLRAWLAPYLRDHPDMQARLLTWVRLRRGDEDQRTA